MEAQPPYGAAPLHQSEICRRMTPTKLGGHTHEESSCKGLNTLVKQPSTCTATVLVEHEEGHHGRDGHEPVPRFTALVGR